jgi:hypothetical protein
MDVSVVNTILATKIRHHFKRFINKCFWTSSNNITSSSPSKKQVWSVGIYVGESPFKLMPPENINNPVVTRGDVSDVRAALVGDPFMLRVNYSWYMFFEVLNRQHGKGEMGLATSEKQPKEFIT